MQGAHEVAPGGGADDELRLDLVLLRLELVALECRWEASHQLGHQVLLRGEQVAQ